jgi:RNA polymerase sigma factor (sigma-70 family)
MLKFASAHKMDPSELFRSSLVLVDRVVAMVSRRARLSPADAEDFGAEFKLALIEKDYAILRKYEGRSALATYMAVVAQRMIYAEQRALGRWHPSAAATQMGESGLLLERILRREKRTIDEALPLLQALDPALHRQEVEAMAARLPPRPPTPRAVELDEQIATTLRASDRADAQALESEGRRLTAQTNEAVRAALQALTLEERSMIRLHFGAGMSIADVSRMLRLPQRPLYRRLQSALKKIEGALQAHGVDAASAADLIGSNFELDFGLEGCETGGVRPTEEREDSVAPPESATP